MCACVFLRQTDRERGRKTDKQTEEDRGLMIYTQRAQKGEQSECVCAFMSMRLCVSENEIEKETRIDRELYIYR